jgi:hypothetical protein
LSSNDFLPISFIPNYYKLKEKESLEFRIKAFEIDPEAIIELKKYIETFPD